MKETGRDQGPASPSKAHSQGPKFRFLGLTSRGFHGLPIGPWAGSQASNPCDLEDMQTTAAGKHLQSQPLSI